MCGIAGVVDFSNNRDPPALDPLRRMCGALRHRGPDEFGIYRDHRAGLAHARLSIIDLDMGQQPMSNADQTLWIVFNGEIYNYVELREELEQKGRRFRTRSDTEVIVHAWEEWGERAFERFNGQWAVALWSPRDGELILSRDRVGIRPLYLAKQGQKVLFASEVKALFAGEPSLARAWDPYGLKQTFTFWSVVPPRSVFQGIEELEPGRIRRYSRGAVTERAYWRPQFSCGRSEGAAALDAATGEVRQALQDATSLRMLRADVPVGCYLSGGLDSSLIASLSRAAYGESLHTFSLRFADAEYDETSFQRLMVERLGAEHHELVVTQQDIAEAFPRVIFHAERPILRTAPAPLFLLSRLVRESGIKVVVTGEGADELFAGYDLFREGVIRRFWAQSPDSDRIPQMLERLYPYLQRSPVSQQAMAQRFFGRDLSQWREPGFAHQLRWRTTAAVQRLFSPQLRAETESLDVVGDLLGDLPPDMSGWTHLAADQYLELRTLLAGYLLSSQGDRMLMAHSVEGRFPFLDVGVIELANRLPDAFKIADLDEKHILKLCARDELPPQIVQRSKQPYRAPDALSFVQDPTPAWVEQALDERALREAGVFDPRLVRRLWEKLRAGAQRGQFSNTDNMALVGVLSTQSLYQQFIAAPPSFDLPARIGTLVDMVNHETK